MPTSITAALLVIGDEILSGRTADKNIAYIGAYLSAMGIDLVEARVIADREDAIIDAVNTLRTRVTYLFTTGGLGPTHDDITADSIAKAFGVTITHDPRAVARLEAHYPAEKLNEARLRMARIPAGAALIDNPISAAPGFRLGNVIVMAGVPNIMQAMLDTIAPTFEAGAPPLIAILDAGGTLEGAYAADLASIAAQYPTLSIGSYPRYTEEGFENKIVLRGHGPAAFSEAKQRLESMIEKHKV